MAQSTSHPPHPPGAGLSAAACAGFALLPASLLVLLLVLLGTPLGAPLPWAGQWAWVPGLGVELAWRIDALAALMLVMISGIGTAVFVYAGGYLAGHPGQRRLYVLLALFMLAMVGCVTADNLWTLFVFWEATSVLSFLLVGFDHEQASSRKSAQQALLVTGSGGLVLLAGLMLLAQSLGSARISEVVALLRQAPLSPTLQAALALVVVGALTKSAQFPFHFWLPNAMAAPTPVSAYLHSATMVKLGVYLLARLDGGLDHWGLWQATLQAIGSLTAAWGMVLALRERDLKRILAWSTVATLGTLVALVGMPGEDAAVAVGALLLAHALYKAPLFFVAGNIDHGTGTRVIDRLGNLRHAMPWTAAAAALAGASMAGLPLSFGYVTKDLIGGAKASADVLALVPLANTVFSAIAVAVAAVAAVRVFWRHPGPVETPEAHEGSLALVAPPLALASLGLLLGLFPMWAQPVVQAVGVAISPGDDPVDVLLRRLPGAQWLSFALPFALGVLIFLGWDPLHRRIDAIGRRLAPLSLVSHYERLLAAIPRVAAATTRVLQHGRLPGYMAAAVGATLALLLWAVWPALATLPLPPLKPPSAGLAGGVALVVAGALAAVLLRQRLAMLLGAGLVGYGSGVVFIFAGAPDVAYTQFVVETVFVVVLAGVLLALQRHGKTHAVPEPTWRPVALLAAVSLATVLTALTLLAVAQPFDATLSDWFGAHSVALAQGRNVVNVILVDFRALDTLGEISVVMLSFLAALPLLRLARPSAAALPSASAPAAAGPSSVPPKAHDRA